MSVVSEEIQNDKVAVDEDVSVSDGVKEKSRKGNKRDPRKYRIMMRKDDRGVVKQPSPSKKKDKTNEGSAEPSVTPEKKVEESVEEPSVDEGIVGSNDETADPNVSLEKEEKKSNKRNSRNNRDRKKEPRRRRISEKQASENKEILDNIISCINIMQDKLSKYDTDESGTDERIGLVTMRLDDVMETVETGNGGYDKTKKDNDKITEDEKMRNGDDDVPRGKDGNRKRKPRKKKSNKTEKKSPEATDATVEEVTAETVTSDDAENNKVNSHFHPTHFLAIRVENQEVHKNVEKLRENIVNINIDFQASFVELLNLHIPLCFMAFKNKQVEATMKALDYSMGKLKDAYKKNPHRFVELEHLTTASGRLFIDVKKSEGCGLLERMIAIFEESLIQQGIAIQPDTLKPRATIMKLRNSFALRRKGYKKIPSDVFETYENEYFGKVELNEILLCSMANKKDEKFYKVVAAIDLKSYVVSVLDKGTSETIDANQRNMESREKAVTEV